MQLLKETAKRDNPSRAYIPCSDKKKLESSIEMGSLPPSSDRNSLLRAANDDDDDDLMADMPVLTGEQSGSNEIVDELQSKHDSFKLADLGLLNDLYESNDEKLKGKTKKVNKLGAGLLGNGILGNSINKKRMSFLNESSPNPPKSHAKKQLVSVQKKPMVNMTNNHLISSLGSITPIVRGDVDR